MKTNIPRLTVAALRGGSGKTTISLGLIAAWRRKGLNPIPFKKGPDYIDAGWLAQAAGNPCYNLDPYLMTQDQVGASFVRRVSRNADLAVIEGNRGLFDGMDAAGTYSTAQLAKRLASPTLLILDCTKATRTLAAIALGCRHFDPELNLAGVILNEVATSRQESVVRRAIETEVGLPVLGAVPRVRTHDLPERHLGLVPHQEHPMARQALEILADLADAHLDLDGLFQLAASAPELEVPDADIWTVPAQETPSTPITVGVIQDSVFQFYYPENLELLERLGAKVLVFSSLHAHCLPEVDALYLGGGFPETHAEVLADNQGLREDIRRASRDGLPIYAECGGLMYLGRGLALGDKTFPMAGVFPVVFGLNERPQGHGYARVLVDRPNPFFEPGVRLVGHEFHYSLPVSYDSGGFNLVFKVERGHGFADRMDGLCVNNTFASYVHLHALSTTKWAEALLGLARARKNT